MIEVRVIIDLSDRVMSLLDKIGLGGFTKGGIMSPKVDPTVLAKVAQDVANAEKASIKRVVNEQVAKAQEERKVTAEIPSEVVEPEPEVVEAEEVNEKPAEETKSSLKITDLRALLREKVNNDDNRDKLTKKLKDLNASSVTSLDKKYYDEFYAYMKTLP